jgi:aspartate aminotransferase
MDRPVASRVAALSHAILPFTRYLEDSSFFERSSDPNVNNFAFGNPQDMPLGAFVDAITNAAQPRDKDWFAYKLSEPESQEVVAASLRQEFGIPFEPDDIAMTNAGFGALTVAIQAIVDPGDEVVFNLPPWFLYESLTVNAGGVPVKVPVDLETFDLDLDAIEAAITPRTRAIIVNSPNNPTGRIYPPETLERLAAMLFEGNTFHTPLAFYPHSLMTYSYGKVLLTPGQRIGYIALPPTMPDRDQLREAFRVVQLSGGFLFPNALLQHALADLDTISIDMARMQGKRDRMVGALREIGYDVHAPQGTFYLLPRSPWADDWEFTKLLEDHDILCLPGTVLEFPGFFRISLTASEEMVERSLAGFSAAFDRAKSEASPVTIAGANL